MVSPQQLGYVVRTGAARQHVQGEGVPKPVRMRIQHTSPLAQCEHAVIEALPGHRRILDRIQQNRITRLRITTDLFHVKDGQEIGLYRYDHLLRPLLGDPLDFLPVDMDFTLSERSRR